MEVQLREPQAAFVCEAIQAGRFSREVDTLGEALMMWERQGGRRAGILAAVDQADGLGTL